MTLKRLPLFVKLDRWLMDHFDREDYITIFDYVSRANSDELVEIIELCQLRTRNLKALSKLAKKSMQTGDRK